MKWSLIPEIRSRLYGEYLTAHKSKKAFFYILLNWHKTYLTLNDNEFYCRSKLYKLTYSDNIGMI